MECNYYSYCLNNTKCYRCIKNNLLKLSKNKTTHSHLYKRESVNKESLKENSWEDLEQTVANSLNRVPDINQARRSRRSGAMYFERGDIVDDILHPECKERTGNFLNGGDRSLSIRKSWLDKARKEVEAMDKIMCLPFRFKGDSHIYTIFDHEDIAVLITNLKAYIQDNELKEQQINDLKTEIDKLKERLNE